MIFLNFRVDHKSEEDSKAYEAVKGSLSTKVEAVVKTLIKIRNDDPNAKALVFSTWNSVLDILESALVTNDIQFATLHVQGKFKRNLQKFKVCLSNYFNCHVCLSIRSVSVPSLCPKTNSSFCSQITKCH